MVYPTSLDIDDYVILQDTDDYAFSQDSVFLANTAKIAKEDRVLDLGCGTGILATLALVKKRASAAVGIELQPSVANLARESAKRNGLEGKFDIITGDVKDIKNLVEAESFDKVLCNPPYFQGEQITKKNLSRIESTATLSDFAKAASYALRFGRRRLVRFENRQAFTAYLRPRAIQTRTQRNDNRLSQTFVGSGRCDNQGKKRRQSRT